MKEKMFNYLSKQLYFLLIFNNKNILNNYSIHFSIKKILNQLFLDFYNYSIDYLLSQVKSNF